MNVCETVALPRPRQEVCDSLLNPDRRDGEGWSDLERGAEGYTATLHVHSGPIAIDFDCRFEIEELEPGTRVRIRGMGVAPRIGFTASADFLLGDSDIRIEADVAVSGSLAGLGQRELNHQARRLLAAYVLG